MYLPSDTLILLLDIYTRKEKPMSTERRVHKGHSAVIYAIPKLQAAYRAPFT